MSGRNLGNFTPVGVLWVVVEKSEFPLGKLLLHPFLLLFSSFYCTLSVFLGGTTDIGVLVMHNPFSFVVDEYKNAKECFHYEIHPTGYPSPGLVHV